MLNMNPGGSPSTNLDTLRRSMKINILSDNRLLNILENDTFSSDDDFGYDQNDDINDYFVGDGFDETNLEGIGILPNKNEVYNVNIISVDHNMLK